jgi:cysteine-rich repeat protein
MITQNPEDINQNTLKRSSTLNFSVVCMISLITFFHDANAQTLNLGSSCTGSNDVPCRPNVIDHIHKSPSVFTLQARVSPAKLPSGRGSIKLMVVLYGDDGEVCEEAFPHPIKIRKGILNVEIGRGMNCALDEVLMENQRVQLELCIGGGREGCLRKLDLTAVPFALTAHSATEVKKAKTATVVSRSDFAHRATADADVLHPTAVGYGYFDFFTPSESQFELFNDTLGLQATQNDGFISWTPVRGAQEGDSFAANHILFVSEDRQGEIKQFKKVELHADQTQLTGHARILKGHMLIAGKTDVSGDVSIDHQLQSLKKLKVSEDLSVTGDSIVVKDLAIGNRLDVLGDTKLRAQVSAETVEAQQGMYVNQQHTHLGPTYIAKSTTLDADTQVRVTGQLTISGENTEQDNVPEVQGLTVTKVVNVEGNSVKLDGETALIRQVDHRNPQASANQGLLMRRADGQVKRVLSLSQSGSIELNKPRSQAEPEIQEIVIKADEINFNEKLELPIDGLNSSCKLVPVGNKLSLRCGDQSFSFAADQCGNGRRFRCSCGDGNVDPGEECDDGDNNDNANRCLRSCAFAVCGDRLTRSDLSDPNAEGYEECDDGNTDDEDACRSNCLNAVCGDGLIRTDLTPTDNDYEECDDGNTTSTDRCTNQCTIAKCGDGHTRTDLAEGTPNAEQCDDNNLDVGDGCDQLCRLEICGNGFIQANEICDDGNNDLGDDCVSCRPAVCGDGHVWRGREQCDDGNRLDTDGCINCQIARCGDGKVYQGVEQCDDQNSNDYDVCRNNCTLHCEKIDKVAHLVDRGGQFNVDTRNRRSTPTQAGGGGPQAAIALTLTQSRYAIFEGIEHSYDSYFHLRNSCDEPQHIAYDDDSNGNYLPKIARFLDPGTYYLIVDGYRKRSGTSTVKVSLAECESVPIVKHLGTEGILNNAFNRIFRIFGIQPIRSAFRVNNQGGVNVTQRHCGGDGPQKAISFVLPWTTTVRFETTSGSDPVLHIRDRLDCFNPTDITCNDDGGRGLNAKITTTLSAGTYYLIVDGYNKRSGDMTIEYEMR